MTTPVIETDVADGVGRLTMSSAPANALGEALIEGLEVAPGHEPPRVPWHWHFRSMVPALFIAQK